MERMMKSEFFTYQEVLNAFSISVPLYPNQKSVSSTWFTDLLDELSLQYQKYSIDASFTDNDVKAIVNSLMTNVYDRHAEDYIFQYVSMICEEDHTLTKDDVRKALSKIINVINITMPKYIVLLKQYKNSSGDPIAPIKSESKGKTRFNDTPQNIGEWDDEDHTTNISSSESETTADTGSLMERLSALYKDYKSIVLEWSNEFNQLFFKEEQL